LTAIDFIKKTRVTSPNVVRQSVRSPEKEEPHAHFVGFAIPHQLDFTIVLEQQEAVLVRQWFARLEKTNDFLLFLFC